MISYEALYVYICSPHLNTQDEKGAQFFYDQGCLDRGDVRDPRRGRGGRGRGGGHGGQKRQYDDREGGDGGPNKKTGR